MWGINKVTSWWHTPKGSCKLSALFAGWKRLSLLSWAANHLCKAYDSGGLQRWVTDFRLPVPSPSTWPSGSSPACGMVSSTARAELQGNSASAPWFVSAVNTQNVPSCALQRNSSHPSNKPSLFVKLSHILSVIWSWILCSLRKEDGLKSQCSMTYYIYTQTLPGDLGKHFNLLILHFSVKWNTNWNDFVWCLPRLIKLIHIQSYASCCHIANH